jgi:probable HAF family extracellular repeat protein
MKSNKLTWLMLLPLFASVAIPDGLAAQEQTDGHAKEHTHYKLIDLGTFGGPNSGFNGGSVVVNNEGTVAGVADTAAPDPFNPICFNFDCFVQHAFRWHNGVLTDLGPLPSGLSSYTNAINSHGLVVGQAQVSVIDPLVGAPDIHAVLWKEGQIIDLGSPGGPISLATAVNNSGLAVGGGFDAISDPLNSTGILYGLAGPTQLRALLWKDGTMQDLGTLGGSNAFALFVNERGQVTGASSVDATPNPDTGFPTIDPFLWQDGKMVDIGTLGGTLGFANSLNNRGHVVGQSDLAGDSTFHPFLWDGQSIKDLGTLGGDFGSASWVNDAGEVVGFAANQNDQAFLAFLWRNGVMTNLGTVAGDPCGVASAINAKGQIVGQSGDCLGNALHAFLWERGAIVDLNGFVPAGSGLQLTEAFLINDSGEIAVKGVLADGDTHAVLLIPCYRGYADEGGEGCTTDDENTNTANQNGAAPIAPARTAATQPNLTPSEMKARVRALLTNRNRRFRGFPPK